MSLYRHSVSRVKKMLYLFKQQELYLPRLDLSYEILLTV